jgi:hypothetical protein
VRYSLTSVPAQPNANLLILDLCLGLCACYFAFSGLTHGDMQIGEELLAPDMQIGEELLAPVAWVREQWDKLVNMVGCSGAR